MGFTGFGHVGYVVKNIDKSIDFYQNILGFKKIADFNTPDRRIVFLQFADGQSIELFSGGTETVATNKETIGFAHTCLIVENMEELVCELKEKGVPFNGEPVYQEDGSGSFRILDPDGNEYECMQRGPNSKF